MGWLTATIQKTAVFHVPQCVNLRVALIGKMPNSVHGWILTDSAKARPVYAIGVNAGAKTISSAANGIGG